MLKIRLSRVGKKGHAQYRIVVAEQSSPIKGKSVEQIGNYDPHTKKLVVKKDRVDYWISNGAQPSNTVQNLFVEKGIIKGDKVKLTFKKKKGEEDEESESDVKKDEEKKTSENAEKKEDKKDEEKSSEDKKDESK